MYNCELLSVMRLISTMCTSKQDALWFLDMLATCPYTSSEDVKAVCEVVDSLCGFQILPTQYSQAAVLMIEKAFSSSPQFFTLSLLREILHWAAKVQSTQTVNAFQSIFSSNLFRRAVNSQVVKKHIDWILAIAKETDLNEKNSTSKLKKPKNKIWECQKDFKRFKQTARLYQKRALSNAETSAPKRRRKNVNLNGYR